MRIPESIKVGGFTYQIEIVEGLWRETGNWGECIHPLSLIKLDASMVGQELSYCFLHEVLHAIDMVFTNRILDESCVSGISQGFHQVFGDMGIIFER